MKLLGCTIALAGCGKIRQHVDFASVGQAILLPRSLSKAFLIILLEFAAVAQNDPEALDGKKLFEKKCGVCHASETTERRIGPSLKGVKEGRLPGGRDATREAILDKLNNGGNGMPVFRELLSDAEKDRLARYVLTL